MQRGYCAVATRYSPALIRNQALSSPQATLKACPISQSLPNIHSQLTLAYALPRSSDGCWPNSQWLLRACIVQGRLVAVTVATFAGPGQICGDVYQSGLVLWQPLL